MPEDLQKIESLEKGLRLSHDDVTNCYGNVARKYVIEYFNEMVADKRISPFNFPHTVNTNHFFSQNIKKYRKRKEWSQFQLAERAEISEQTVNSIEGLRLWPSDKTLAKNSNALEVDMYKLFVPQKFDLHSESIVDLKHAVVKTVETLIHDTLQDWEDQ